MHSRLILIIITRDVLRKGSENHASEVHEYGRRGSSNEVTHAYA